MKKILNWVIKNRVEFGIILSILVVSAFMRLYNIDQYMTFLGDEGRDALIVQRFITTGDIPLIGPPTSVGGMYLGPLYYYMMAVPMTLFFLNPLAAAVQVALIGVASVGLIYYLARSWFGKVAAISASVLYAFSPVTIIYSRSSWNPNPAPFFALILIISLYWTHRSKNYRWLILTGAATAFAVQMHYLALILVPIAGLLWLWELIQFKKTKLGKHFVSGSVLGIVAFLLLMSPLFIFDLKHDFMNYKALSMFFTDRQTTVNLNIFNTLNRFPLIYVDNLVGRYITLDNPIIKWTIALVIFEPLFVNFYLWKFKKQPVNWGIFALYTWLIIGISGLVLYKQTIYDHYLGFINPAPFLIIGAITTTASLFKSSAKKIFMIVFGIFVVALLIGEIMRSPLSATPNNQLKRTQEIAQFVIEKSGDKPFNFALIAEHNYDAAYQFYLGYYGHKPSQLPKKEDQLLVVCEDKMCAPVGHPKHEISAFGWTKIENQQKYNGVEIFKLVHNPDEEKSKK